MLIMFSVVNQLYNKESYALETIRIIFTQTYTGSKHFVMGDAFNDKSLEMVRQLEDKKWFWPAGIQITLS